MPDRASHRRIAVALGLLVWFSCAWFGSWEGNPNNATRLFAAISLVEDGDATIDEFAALTIDKAQFGGHAYLDKAPGMTLMALPAMALADRLTGQSARDVSKLPGAPDMARFLRVRLRLAVASGPAVLAGVAAALLFELALALTGSATGALVAAVGFALGTPAWAWSTTILGHAAVASLYVIALWALWRGGKRPALMALAGAALGWAVVIEYQAVLAGGVLALFALVRVWGQPRRWALLGAALAGGVAALLPLVGYNLIAFGTPFKLGYQGVVGFEGMNRGLFGLGWPDPAVLLQLIAGPRRGLPWVAPILLLAPPGLAALAKRDRGVAWTTGLTALVVLLVNAAYFYWDGGNATGPRHATPAVGLLALALAPYWAATTSRGRPRGGAGGAGAVGRDQPADCGVRRVRAAVRSVAAALGVGAAFPAGRHHLARGRVVGLAEMDRAAGLGGGGAADAGVAGPRGDLAPHGAAR